MDANQRSQNPGPQSQCRWCGQNHAGEACPAIAEIEYEADGVTIKRVVFRDKPPSSTTQVTQVFRDWGTGGR